MGLNDPASLGFLTAVLAISAAVTFGLWRHRDCLHARRALAVERRRTASALAAMRVTEERFRVMVDTEQQLHEVSRQILKSQEEERRRFARELQDELTQQLALLTDELEQLRLHPPSVPSELTGRLQQLWNRTTGISSDVYRISHQLHPSRLEALGLVASLQGFCREVSEQHRLRVAFTHTGVPSAIPTDTMVCTYRVVQEALRNVVKHSGAAAARVHLAGDDRGLHLEVADDGHGFNVAIFDQDRLGLVSMRERLHAVGGDMSIYSAPSAGTRLDVRIPLGAAVRQETRA